MHINLTVITIKTVDKTNIGNDIISYSLEQGPTKAEVDNQRYKNNLNQFIGYCQSGQLWDYSGWEADCRYTAWIAKAKDRSSQNGFTCTG